MSSTLKNTNKRVWNDTFSNAALVLARRFSSPQEFSEQDPALLEELDLSPWPALERARAPWLAAWREALDNPEAALLAYSKLFLGPFEIQVSPYASHDLDPAHRLMGETSMWVAERYAAAGLEPPADRPCDAPDHLRLECEFLYYLGYRKSTDDAIWETRIEEFLDDHFLKWAPRCAEGIATAGTSTYHRAAAGFLLAWLALLTSHHDV